MKTPATAEKRPVRPVLTSRVGQVRLVSGSAGKITMRVRCILSQLLALFTLLAILAAPMCSSLCAANVCGGGSTAAHCHEPESDAGSGAFFRAAKNCARAELVAVFFKGNEDLPSLRPFANSVVASFESQFGRMGRSDGENSSLELASADPLENLPAFLDSSVLRI
jgi:hypothetical protein